MRLTILIVRDMYEIKLSKNFRKSYKRVSSSKQFPIDDFNNIFSFLELGSGLPEKCHDHALKGDFFGLRECHISGDCLLLYEIDHTNKHVRFVNIGNHANLFE